MDLTELIKAACADGELDDSDRILLEKKAKESGMSNAQLNTLINEALGIKAPEPPSPEHKHKKHSLLFAILVLVAIAGAVIYWFLNTNTRQIEPSSTQNDTISQSPVDEHLQELMQIGESLFKSKNIARAKAHLAKALNEYPDNQDIKIRIAECDKILKQSDYKSLKQVHENGKLGYMDSEDYIVIDFHYDTEIELHGEMLLLKNGEKYGVVGGSLKTPTETKYIESQWIADEKSFRMIKNSTGDCDFLSMENGNLIINEY